MKTKEKSMNLITVDAERCNGDGLCVKDCPAKIIVMGEDGLPIETPEAYDICIRCGHCVAVCPKSALKNSRTNETDYLPASRDLPTAQILENLLLARRSTRQFKDGGVDRDALEKILEIGRRAPTASNSQNIAWIVIENAGRLARIRELCVECMRKVPGREHYVKHSDLGQDMVLRGAPVLIVAHAPADYFWGQGDSAVALTYQELLAISMGLGVCWAGLVTWVAGVEPKLREELGLPDGQNMVGGLMIGAPAVRYAKVPAREPLRVQWR
jgi:nitroreductase/Pyruvate/2-oxoacid:ferredoxin oxidoreductase delta subunit